MVNNIDKDKFYTLVTKTEVFNNGEILGVEIIEDETDIRRGNWTNGDGYKYCSIRLRKNEFDILNDDEKIKEFIRKQLYYGMRIKPSDLEY